VMKIRIPKSQSGTGIAYEERLNVFWLSSKKTGSIKRIYSLKHLRDGRKINFLKPQHVFKTRIL